MANQSPLSVLNNTQAAVSTAENMGGIPVTETPTSAETTGPIVKAPTVKGGFSVPGNVALDPTQTAELLANMQAMIDKRTGGWHDFMSGLQDTMALATPPRLGGPTQAMATRANQKRQEQEDIFNMRAQMSALKAGAAQAQNQREVMQQILGGGGGEGGAPSVFGGVQQIPTEIRQAMAMDPVNAPTILQKYLTTTAGETAKARLNPAWAAPTEVIDKQGQIIKVPLWQATELALENPNNPKNRAVIKVAQDIPGPAPTLATTAAGTPQGNAEGIARSLGVPLTSGTRSYDKQAAMYADSQKPGYAGPVVAKPETSRHVTGNAVDVDMKKVTPEQLQALRDAGFKQTVPSEPWHWELTAAKPTQVAGPVTSVGGGDMPPTARPGESAASLQKRTELWQKQQEANIGSRIKSGEEERKKAGDMIAAVEQNAKNADEVIRTADRVIQHATKYPKEFGYGYQQENPVLAGAANIPGVGTVVEKVAPAMFGAPGESKRRSVTDADARKLGLDFAAQMFSGTGARLGVGLEQMAANAKGVGTELPAETNALNANLVKVAAEKAREQAAAWREWRKTHGGESADPYDFMQSPENKRITEKYDRKLDAYEEEAKRIYPEFFGEKTGKKKDRKPLNAIFGGQ